MRVLGSMAEMAAAPWVAMVKEVVNGSRIRCVLFYLEENGCYYSNKRVCT
jgi:uncharacterized Fe-S cluster-containing MiaB family protein